MLMNVDGGWKANRPVQNTGKLCYHYCSAESHLPIRDVLNHHRQGFKAEPNYETATYNLCTSCNQPSVHAAVKNGFSHILFITRYTGSNPKYADRYFIVGYYEIGWISEVDGRLAVRAGKIAFAPVAHAYEVTEKRWQRINRNGRTRCLGNLRHATQCIRGSMLKGIVAHLDRHDVTYEYLREVSRLKSAYNPFKEVPTGRIFIINVGANTSNALQSPLFEDGRFELVPIPEDGSKRSKSLLRYADLRQFNAPSEPLLALFPDLPVNPEERAHNDPEFDTLTYGDNIRLKSNLRRLKEGDLLFFLARLVPYDGQRFNRREAIFALVGYLEIAERIDRPDDLLFASPAFSHNAHVRRWMAAPSSFEGYAVFKGSAKSRRFRYAVPFNREFVDHVPILKADGSRWEWERTTELGVIGSNTRTARMHIDPGIRGDRGRAKRFWQRMREAQRW